MADVQGQIEVAGRCAQPAEELEVAGRPLDEHARLGFEADAHAVAGGVREQGIDPLDQPGPDRVGRRPGAPVAFARAR